jgi:TrmH family RNA methyltransferase
MSSPPSTVAEPPAPTRHQISEWARLTQKKFRRERGQFLIEGDLCVREAIRARLKIEAILVLASEAEKWAAARASSAHLPWYTINSETLQRFAKVESSQGIVGVARTFQLAPRKSPFAMACEQVSDPGNCGALIRVADFFGASELFLGADSAEIWNGKVVRGSMGSLFRQPVQEDAEIEKVVREWPGSSVAMVAHGGTPLRRRPNLKPPVLLILGHETRGLSKVLAEHCTHRFTLEGHGGAESLNLVTAAAVFAYALTS